MSTQIGENDSNYDIFGTASERAERERSETEKSLQILKPFVIPTPNNSPKTSPKSNEVEAKCIDDYYETSRVLKHIQSALRKIPVEQRFRQSSDAENRSCAVGKLSYVELADHLIKLRTEYIQKLARPIVQKLMSHPKNTNIFNSPVDPIAQHIPNYVETIKHPMDLGTVKARLQSNYYDTIQQCFDDIRLVFRNAIKFNGAAHPIGRAANELLAEFDKDLAELEDRNSKSCSRKTGHSCSLCSGALCLLCGEKCLRFETAGFFCHAPSCNQKIKKNAHYYITADGMMSWCQRCYGALPNVVLDGDMVYPKRSLLKRRFDEEVAEPWVQCDKCSYWFHGICALYTPLFDGTDAADKGFVCPLCVLESGASDQDANTAADTAMETEDNTVEAEVEERLTEDVQLSSDSEEEVDSVGDAVTLPRKAMPTSPCSPSEIVEGYYRGTDTFEMDYDETDADNHHYHTDSDAANVSLAPSDTDLVETHSQWSADTLPHTVLGDFLESLVKELLVHHNHADAAQTVKVRMTSNIEQTMQIGAPLADFAEKVYGKAIPNRAMKYKQKCIQLFQNIDGVDVFLFCLYVQEFDRHCPEPNNNLVYIAYLDSVDYFRPMGLRSLVYQEIVAGYLAYARQRGFKQCHFWACPPQRGDNFIFWCHPLHQRTPTRDRLNGWYHSILARSKALGVHSGTAHLWTLYFSRIVLAKDGSGVENASKPTAGTKRTLSNPGLVKIFQSRKYQKNTEAQKQQAAAEPLPEEDSQSSSNSNNSSEGGPLIAKAMPPIFEGDYWIQEFYRCYHANLQKTRQFSSHQHCWNYRKCRDLLKTLINRPAAVPFRHPVDIVALNIPTYPDIVKRPMDLGTVREKLRKSMYATMLDFAEDVRLVFHNAMAFNPEGHPIHKMAADLVRDFDKELRTIAADSVRNLGLSDDRLAAGLDEYIATCRLADETAAENANKPVVEANCVTPFLYDDCNSNSGGDQPKPSSSLRTVSSLPDLAFPSPRGVQDVLSSRPMGATLSASSSGDDLAYSYGHGHGETPAQAAAMISRVVSMDDAMLRETRCHRRESVDSLASSLSTSTNAEGANSSNSNSSSSGGLTSWSTQCLSGLVSDLSKAIQRLNDDLFIVKFTSLDTPLTAPPVPVAVPNSNSANSSGDGAGETAVSVVASPLGVNGKKKALPKYKQKILQRQLAAAAKQASASVPALYVPSHSHALLQRVIASPDTAVDPDPLMSSPLLDSRHTFLEMAQCLHLQFDSLRRAKHSSLVVLGYQHLPADSSIGRLRCAHCRGVLQQIRWHCDQCADYDLCAHCYSTASPKACCSSHSHDSGCEEGNSLHPHSLIPYRITFK